MSRPLGKDAGWYAFNINERVRVQLTTTGRNAVLQAGRDFRLEENEDAEGYSEWQLWELMQIVGPTMQMGREPPFIACVMLFAADKATPC